MIARNTVIDYYRQRSRQGEPMGDEHVKIPDEQKDLLRQQILDSELNEALKGLENLKDEYKEVIVLKFLDELSNSEIADILGRSNGAIRVLLHRAMKALKENIENIEN